MPDLCRYVARGFEKRMAGITDLKGIPPHKKFGCSCGRSPVGRCVGWHKLSDKRWIETLAEYQKMTPKQREGFLSPKAIDGLGE